MYQETMNQLTVYDFVTPFGGRLDEENRWVKLTRQIDWCALEEEYAAHFSRGGKQAIGVRCAFGSLVIKTALGLSDVQTVLAIAENPYMQYLIGMNDFYHYAPFAPRTMASFRRRISQRQVDAAVKLLDKRSARKSKK